MREGKSRQKAKEDHVENNMRGKTKEKGKRKEAGEKRSGANEVRVGQDIMEIGGKGQGIGKGVIWGSRRGLKKSSKPKADKRTNTRT